MKAIGKASLSLLWLLLLARCSSPPSPSHSELLASYTAVQEALAADDDGQARMALAEFTRELSLSSDLRALAERAREAENPDEIRRAFAALSERMAEEPLPEGYVVAFCPMANGFQGAHWLQEEGDLSNPYFGAAMLRCGEVVRRPGD